MESQSLFMELWLILVENWKLIVILTGIFAIYCYYTATFDFFKVKGIPYVKPTIFLGNYGSRLLRIKSFHDYELETYNHFKGNRFGGTFEGRTPVLYILDPDLIKSVMIRDFNHLTNRNVIEAFAPRYLQQILLTLKGAEWKGVRRTMTPVFSAARLKNMLPLLKLCSNQMVTYLSQFENTDVEMKEAMGHYTLEVIGACAFGIKGDALNKKDAHFITVAKQFDYMSKPKRMCLFILWILAPKLVKYIPITLFNLKSTDELLRILQVAKAEREMDDFKKMDFLQILVDVAKKENREAHTETKYLDGDTIDAQCLLFLLAGFETSSTLLSYALHVLATKPEVQDKLRAHVQEHTEGKEITYELLSELTYLDAFLHETLRMYPPVGRVDRVVTKPYTLPDSRVRLSVGDIVAIPVYGIHMDPQHYPEPREFRPERFLGDEKNERPSHLFLAFGAGPRNCLGLRFAMISAKIALVSLIQNFKFTKCAKTQDPVLNDKRSSLLKAGSGVWVTFDKIKPANKQND